MRNILVAILTLVPVLCAQEDERVVHVFVSLDREHSEKVLAQFEEETGIRVEARYDTEANKTVGLVQAILTERDDPWGDVYWNNELATTIKLQEHGVLQPYRSPMAETIPAEFKDEEGYWTGFAARARVLIVNTDLVGPDEMPDSMWSFLDPQWKGRTCMAWPRTGTTAAHAAALYVKDAAEADRWFDGLVANDVTWLTGNAHCMREVSAGRFAFGWTDTDDFNVARIQGKPVARVFPDKGEDDIGVMYLPNSLVLLAGAKHPDEGKALIDWLLRPETERMLAQGATAQIPVRPGVETPEHVRRPDQVGKVMAVDWDRVGKEYDRWVTHAMDRLEGAQESGSMLVWILVAVVVVAGAVVLVLKRATGEPV